ncbi:hypothetical protein PM082_001123 [Marasmius tenuissimus]|nr:hypothetical protein PM082_001123 [Marasmius tenuissimus]
MGQISFTPAMVIGTWIEGIAYGVFLCLYLATLWLKRISRERNAQSGEKSDGSFTAMFIISSVMFFIATLHMGLAGYRLAKVWIVGDNLAPPTASLTTMDTWDNTMWTILYVTQELLGTGAAIYRCWLIWHKNWRVIVLPSLLLLVEIGIGYIPCAIFSQTNILEGKTHPLLPYLGYFMKTFYALTVIANIIPTGLMAYRLWRTHYQSASSAITTPAILFPVLRILVESASLQLIAETVLLGFFSAGRQEQFMIFGLITPIVGITFNLITVRIKLVSYTVGQSRSRVIYPSNDSNQWHFESHQLQRSVSGSYTSWPPPRRPQKQWVDARVMDISSPTKVDG